MHNMGLVFFCLLGWLISQPAYPSCLSWMSGFTQQHVKNVEAPSAVSQLNFRVDGLQFGAGVVDFHLPIDATLGFSDVARPSGCFTC